MQSAYKVILLFTMPVGEKYSSVPFTCYAIKLTGHTFFTSILHVLVPFNCFKIKKLET